MIAVGVAYFALVLARVAAFVALLPLLGGNQMPRTVKAGLTIALTVFWGTTFLGRVPPGGWLSDSGAVPWLCLGVALGREALLGAIVGYAFGLFLVPARVAGEFLSQEMGMSFANQVSATGDGSSTPLTNLFELIAGAIFFGLDGHHVFLGVMHGSFINYPVGSALPQLPLESIIRGASATEEWGLMLAAPVALCLFLTTIVLALLARATPQLNLYSFGFPLRLGVGLVATLLLLPQSLATLVSIFGHFGDFVGRLL